MKKINLLFSIAALVCMTACSNQEFTDISAERHELQYISRTPIENEAQLESFYVWAQRDNAWQFEKVLVSRQGDTWKSNETNLWQAGTYNFYAITGTEPSSVTANLNGDFVISVGENETDLDLMTAVSSGIAYPVTEGDPSPVAFHFYHEKAQIEITVKTSAQLLDGVTIKSITLSNFYKGGTFTRTFLGSGIYRGTWKFGTDTDSWKTGSEQFLESGSSYKPLEEYMIPAQQLSGVTLSFDYKIGSESYSKEFELTKATGSGNWLEAGIIYDYNFTIRPEGIVFDGITMDEWKESHSGGDINIEE